jgi:DNA-binding FadR family transcriptional regulator
MVGPSSTLSLRNLRANRGVTPNAVAAGGPLLSPRSLTDGLVARLSGEILSGRPTPGGRLPTEHAMMRMFRVSRTVVREAVSRLKAEGLVTTRQGLGAFVSPDARKRPFRLDGSVADSITEALRIMQLRMSVEIEAAGIAAENRTKPHRGQMTRALAQIDRSIRRGELAVQEDFELHRAIADATGNPYFVKFLDFLGHFIIPRWTVQRQARSPAEQKAYLIQVQKEHRQIVACIAAGKPDAARDAMRTHLAGSRARYQSLAKELRSLS